MTVKIVANKKKMAAEITERFIALAITPRVKQKNSELMNRSNK
jgi:hypothetical protein